MISSISKNEQKNNNFTNKLPQCSRILLYASRNTFSTKDYCYRRWGDFLHNCFYNCTGRGDPLLRRKNFSFFFSTFFPSVCLTFHMKTPPEGTNWMMVQSLIYRQCPAKYGALWHARWNLSSIVKRRKTFFWLTGVSPDTALVSTLNK